MRTIVPLQDLRVQSADRRRFVEMLLGFVAAENGRESWDTYVWRIANKYWRDEVRAYLLEAEADGFAGVRALQIAEQKAMEAIVIGIDAIHLLHEPRFKDI